MAARQDPTLVVLYKEFKDPARATAFLRHFDLLPAVDIVGQIQRNGNGYLALYSADLYNPRKPNCHGKIKEVIKNGNPMFRRTACRSEKLAHHGASAYDPPAPPVAVVFNSLDSAGRPNRRVSLVYIKTNRRVNQIDPQDVIYIAFCLAYELHVATLPVIIGRRLGKEAVVYWSQKIRECALNELDHAPKMGGVGDIVEVDECFMRGRPIAAVSCKEIDWDTLAIG